jgi:hypothetical protein
MKESIPSASATTREQVLSGSGGSPGLAESARCCIWEPSFPPRRCYRSRLFNNLLSLKHFNGVWTPIFRNLSNSEQSPSTHRCNLLADMKELCSSGGAAVYSYTGKVAHPPAAPHLTFFERCSRSESSDSAARAFCARGGKPFFDSTAQTISGFSRRPEWKPPSLQKT